jgi:hypothetical protein
MSNISDHYQKLGAATGPLGGVVGTETSAPWGGVTQKYQRGQIFFHAETGAHALTGVALDALVAAGGVAELGYPLEDATTTADGQVAYFERGCVLSGASGAFVCRLRAPLIGRKSGPGTAAGHSGHARQGSGQVRTRAGRNITGSSALQPYLPPHRWHKGFHLAARVLRQTVLG